MTRLRRIAAAALGAGVAGGLLLAVLQAAWVTPLILEAETYEHAAQVTKPQAHAPAAEPWKPAEGAQRFALTALSDVLAGVGFALLLAAGMSLRSLSPTLAEGLLWGAGGYAAFALAPALGLPPELPGAAVAPLVARQVWWLGTVAATAAGLALLAFAPRRYKALGALLLFAPHVIGAPQPQPGAEAGMPAVIAARFVAAVLITSAALWAVLGALCAALLARLR